MTPGGMVAAGASSWADGFELRYLDAAETERHAALVTAAGQVAFEDTAPVRAFPSYRGQRNYPGLYWASVSRSHVGYESWLERDTACLLDFNPDVVGIAAQPFWLHWHDGQRPRRHAPDYFARLADGGGLVVDCRPAERIRPQDAAAFEATRRACAEVGWRYELVCGHDPVLLGNVRWLAGYRHPRFLREDHRARLVEGFTRPTPLLAGVEAVGDRIAVLPSLFHLLWIGVLTADLVTAPLAGSSLVSVRGGGR